MIGRRIATFGVLGGVVLSLLLGGPSPSVSVAADPPPCTEGLKDSTVLEHGALLDVQTEPDGDAVAVGYDTAGSRKVMLTGRWTGGDWQFSTQGLATVKDPILVAVAVGPGGVPWGAGTALRDGRSVPLVVRLIDGVWVDVSPPPPSGRSGIATAIDVSPDGDVWVAGFSVGKGTAARPLVHQRSGKSWVTHTLPRIGADARLAGIVAATGGRATAVGGIVRNGIRPLVLTYDRSEWRRDTVLVEGPGVVLTAIEGDATSWVSGWRVDPTTISPLLLRRTPDGWGEEPLPSGSGVIGSLLDLAQPVEGLPWIVGTGYFSAPSNLAPLVSRFGGSAWSPYVVPWHGGWYLSDIAGDPQVDGWVLGKATRNGPERGNLLSRVCEVSPGAARRSRTRIRANGEERAHGRTVGDHQHGDLTIAVRHRPIPGLKAVPALPRPTASDRVRLRDVATSVGLDGQQVTYGAWVGDLDDNGQKDIVLSRHGQALGVFVRGPGGYQELPRAGFPASDRHGCAVAPLDEGALGDIVCSTGGQEGVGLTTFELILDPASGARDDLGTERGISDPTARGRLVVALDADSDGDLDLYLGNVDTRYDGLPSVNRLLLNDGQGSFSWAAQSGLTGSYSVEDAAARDIDRDGDPDLVVTLNAKAPRGPGVRIFRNDQGTFTEVARSLGVRTIGDLQADVVQLGGNRRPDLVQMAEGRLRISLWKDGAYRVVYERRLTDGRGFAVGDADGDGANDIYLLLGRVNGNRDDVLLLNDGTGRRWTPVKVPSVSGGAPAGVVAFDHNGDQRSDFLVLNGVRAPGGRIQLLVSSTP